MNQGTTILTLNNGYHLFSRKVGEGPIKLLCVHGGPGGVYRLRDVNFYVVEDGQLYRLT